MSTETTKIGIIGCGNISGIYLQNIKRFRNIESVAVADIDMERAKAKAQEYDIPKVLTPEQLLADPDVEIVLNLTVPKAHAEVSIAALEAGKHVYNEKPLATSLDHARKILDIAGQNNLRVGSAPDTFLGAALQTCRSLVDEGVIGEPVAATGFMMGRGPEPWHPDPEFFYKPGGGPMLDMGPYYITALVNMIGGVKRVSGSARASFAERIVGSGKKEGEKIKVEIPTHIAGTLDFANGAIGTLVMSFDVVGHTHSTIEVYGSEGTILVPDPNNFGGVIKVAKYGTPGWEERALTHSFAENSRGVGLADMAAAIRENRPHRASGQLAYHVLDVMLSVIESATAGRRLDISSKVDRPAPLPNGLAEDSVTL